MRVSLISADGKRRKRKKTSTARNSTNPVWNEALVFNVSRDRLESARVELSIFNDNLLGTDEQLGEVVISSATSGDELAHWTDVLNLKNAMARWHRVQAPSACGGVGPCS